ncbi:hypothetical protein DSECCO2_541420 [anaerobic digester metagenome]
MHLHQHLQKPVNAIQRSTYLVAHIRQKVAFGDVGGLSFFFGLQHLCLQVLLISYIYSVAIEIKLPIMFIPEQACVIQHPTQISALGYNPVRREMRFAIDKVFAVTAHSIQILGIDDLLKTVFRADDLVPGITPLRDAVGYRQDGLRFHLHLVLDHRTLHKTCPQSRQFILELFGC